MLGLKPLKPEKYSRYIILIWLIVGTVFLSEGIQKLLYPAIRGAGRFIKIGLPLPEFLSYFVASFEVLCGILILFGLVTTLAALPLIFIMLVAIGSTKVPTLLNEGFWQMAHASRTDFSMLLGGIFLFLSGGGKWSLDRYLRERSKKPE